MLTISKRRRKKKKKLEKKLYAIPTLREERCLVGISPTKTINRRLVVGCFRPSEAIMANPIDLVTDLIYWTHLLFMKSHISLPHPSESRLPEFPTNVRKGLDQKEIMRQQLYSKG